MSRGMVYLSASYARKKEISTVVLEFRRQGYHVVSTWHDSPGMYDNANDANAGELAEGDLAELGMSNIYVGFTDGFYNRSGHHVELGAALVLCEEVYVVGPVENHFHRHRRVTRVDDIDRLWELVGGVSAR